MIDEPAPKFSDLNYKLNHDGIRVPISSKSRDTFEYYRILRTLLKRLSPEDLLTIKTLLYVNEYISMDITDEDLAKIINQKNEIIREKDKKMAELEDKVLKLEEEQSCPTNKFYHVHSKDTYNVKVEIGKSRMAKPKLYKPKE